MLTTIATFFTPSRIYAAVGVVVLAAAIGLYINHLHGRIEGLDARVAAEVQSHKATKASFIAAAAEAEANHLKRVRSLELQWKEDVDAREKTWNVRLAAANDGLVRWQTRTITVHTTGPSGTAEITGPANTFAPSGMSLVDDRDLQICTTNTLKALEWSGFYGSVQAGQ
jgi:hypothetical protein